MGRYLRGNHRSGCPSLFIAFDTETKPIANPANPRQECNPAWLICGVRWRTEAGKVRSRETVDCRNSRQWWSWVETKTDPRKRLWLFSHNLYFDLTATQFWDRLDGGGWRFAYRNRGRPRPGEQGDQCAEPTGMCCLEDPPLILDLETPCGHRVTMVDLMNYFPRKLSQLGQWVGLPQLPTPGDEGTDGAWLDRCKRDAGIVEAVVNRLVGYVRQHELGNLRYTTAAQSLAMYRHRCLEEKVVIGHPDGARHDERRSYYGMLSRCHFWGAVGPDGSLFPECPGDRRDAQSGRPGPMVYRLDVNSCYPFVMKDNPYPVAYRETQYDVDVDLVEARLRDEECCALVTVNSWRHPYPRKADGTTRWELGTRATWLPGPELRAALDREDVKHVHAVHWHRRGRPFQCWYGAIMALKRAAVQENDGLLAELVKSMSVSLYGKLAQLLPRWQLVKGVAPAERWGTFWEQDEEGGAWRKYRAIAGEYMRHAGAEEHPENYPLMAAYVTSYARLHLAKAVAAAGPRQVPYQDADSIHVLREGFLRMHQAGWISDDEPGKLKVEAAVSSAEWHGQKNYRMGPEWVRAGVPPGREADATGLFSLTRWYGAASGLNGLPPIGPVTEDVRVALPAPRIDGVIGPDGWVDWSVSGG